MAEELLQSDGLASSLSLLSSGLGLGSGDLGAEELAKEILEVNAFPSSGSGCNRSPGFLHTTCKCLTQKVLNLESVMGPANRRMLVTTMMLANWFLLLSNNIEANGGPGSTSSQCLKPGALNSQGPSTFVLPGELGLEAELVLAGSTLLLVLANGFELTSLLLLLERDTSTLLCSNLTTQTLEVGAKSGRRSGVGVMTLRSRVTGKLALLQEPNLVKPLTERILLILEALSSEILGLRSLDSFECCNVFVAGIGIGITRLRVEHWLKSGCVGEEETWRGELL
ncbi:hypothetical protein FB45DRAFT_945092 [Roridomyces roridus]|uniref:Uncharacterized protein n=1 Tax=Roridomyces roridus TaxID=1738132 RepID=A0AAD7FBF1_9AGAR|nr:hypothetical protein FB45DRAFT_945092 [Roridomyces roridus]